MNAWMQHAEAVRIRHLTRADLGKVAEIEARVYPFPWTRGIFADCLRVGYGCWGLEADRHLIGYAIISFGPEEAHLLNICLHPDAQGRGYGRQLLNWSIDQAVAAGSKTLFLEVRPSNRRAIALYRQRGFRRIGRRPGYYPAPRGREDAEVMSLRLPAADQAE